MTKDELMTAEQREVRTARTALLSIIGVIGGWFLYIAALAIPLPWFYTAIGMIASLVGVSIVVGIKKSRFIGLAVGFTVGYVAAFLFIIWIMA